MIGRLIGPLLDKLLFGLTLLLALQVPQLADHYQQFLSGWFESTQWQVEGYEATAKEFGYADAAAMIEQHQQNSEPSVRADAEQKLATLALYDELKTGISLFREGNLLSQSIYMFAPSRYNYLEKTIDNFKPGIPLTTSGLLFGAIVGLMLNLIVTQPFLFFIRRRKVKHSKLSSEKTLV